jgi:hypothetical protein
MHRLHVTEKRGKLILANSFGVFCVCLAVLCAMQGMVEDAY